MALTPATNIQIPDHAILDHFGKQAYLGNSYLVSSGLVSLSNSTEVAILYIANSLSPGASGSGKGIFHSLRKLLCDDVTNDTGILYKIYPNVTNVSSGTAITPTNARLASANTSIATVTLSPTWSVAGTPILEFTSNYSAPTIDQILMILDPGQNIMITGKATASTTALIDCAWWEL